MGQGMIYVMMGGEADGIERYYRQAWEKLQLSREDNIDRSKVEEWLRNLLGLRERM